MLKRIIDLHSILSNETANVQTFLQHFLRGRYSMLVKSFPFPFVVWRISVCEGSKVAECPRDFTPVLYLALVSVDNTVQIPLTRPMLALCGEGVSSPRGLQCEHATPTPIVVESSNRYFSGLKIPFQWTPFIPSPFIFRKETFSSFAIFLPLIIFFQEIQSRVPIKKF